MKRIIVIGCPGSGKSVLSTSLGQITKIPLHHLDMMYWNSDKTTVSREIFLSRLHEVLSEDEWIIDGNYSSSMDMRISACDTVIFLDYPTEVCIDGVKGRIGTKRADMPWVETEEDVEFMEYIKGFSESQRPAILALIDKYREQKEIIILKSREEGARLLLKLREDSEK